MNDDDRRLLRLHLTFLHRTGGRPDTVRQRRDNTYRLREALGVPLAEVTVDQLERWQDDLRKRRLAAATIRAYTSHTRAFYRWAAHLGHVDPNPAVDLLTPKVPRGRPRPIAEDKLKMAIVCAAEPIRTWLILSAYVGLRAGEIARLTRESIGDGVLYVDGKGGKPRTVPLSADVLEELEPHVHGPGPIWRGRTGRPLDPGQVSRRCCAHLAEVGAGVKLHSGRHRYGSRLYRLSNDLRMVQEALGHSSPATTAVYVEASAEAGRLASDRLARELRATRRGAA